MRPFKRIWHDTPGGTLVQGNIALAEDDGAWRAGPIQTATAAWTPDVTWLPAPSTSPDAALGHALDAPLIPLVVLAGERWQAQMASNKVGVCLLTAQWQTLTAEQSCCRLLLEGSASDVAETATNLAQSVKLALPQAGLSEEAMAFARGEPPVARRLGAPRLRKGLSAEQGFVEIVSHLTEVIGFWANRVPSGEALGGLGPIEPVHQMRVALRRLRSAFRAFGPIMGCPALDAIKADLKRVAERLGPPRDWDVFLSETLHAVMAALPEEAALHRLQRAALRRRQEEYAKLNSFCAEGGFVRLAVALACLTLERPWARVADDLQREAQLSPLETVGAQLMRRRYRHVLARGEHFADLPVTDLHALRLQTKRLRYLGEFCEPLFAGKSAARFLRRLSRLQEKLGALNDGAVAQQLLQSLPKATRRAQGIVLGYVAGRTEDKRDVLAKTWKRFRKQDAFW